MDTKDAKKILPQPLLRPVPYFKCFAANTIADRSYRLMGLAERGLWISLYLECWVNGNAPSKPAKLAKILGIQDKEVEEGLTENVLHFFEIRNEQLHSPELDGNRAEYEASRIKKSEGGIEGAKRKKEMARARAEFSEHPQQPSSTQGYPSGLPSGSLNSITSNSITSNSFKSNSLIGKEVPVVAEDPWITKCFGDTEESKEYKRQSRGG